MRKHQGFARCTFSERTVHEAQLCGRRSERPSLAMEFINFEALHEGNSATSSVSPQSPYNPLTVAEQSPNSPLWKNSQFPTNLDFKPGNPFFESRFSRGLRVFHRGLFGDCTGTVRRLFGDCLNSHRSHGANDGRRLSRRRRNKLGIREDETFRARSTSRRSGMHNGREYFSGCRAEGLGGACMHITDPCRLARV